MFVLARCLAKRHSEPAIDAAAKALSRFEVYTRCPAFGIKVWGVMTIRCFRPHSLLWALRVSSRLWDWKRSTGAAHRPSGKFSVRPSPAPAYHILTLTASETPSSKSVSRFARLRSSSRPGDRTSDTRRCWQPFWVTGRWRPHGRVKSCEGWRRHNRLSNPMPTKSPKQFLQGSVCPELTCWGHNKQLHGHQFHLVVIVKLVK